MVAVGVFVPDAPYLAKLHVLAASCVRIFREGRRVWVVAWLSWCLRIWLSKVLARKKEHLFVEAADYGDLRLLGILLRTILSLLLWRSLAVSLLAWGR